MSNARHTRLLILGSGPAGYSAAVYAARQSAFFAGASCDPCCELPCRGLDAYGYGHSSGS